MKKTTSVKPFSESRFSAKNARVVLAGVPLDATGSFRSGTRHAPSAIREISWHLEDYCLLDGRSILEAAFYDAGDVHLTGDLKNNLREIEKFTTAIIRKGKKPLLMGGEHLVTYPVVKALAKSHADLHVVIFDAHIDMGDSSRKMKLSHACVTRLILERLGSGKIFLLGARSGSRKDEELLGDVIIHSSEGPSEEMLRTLRSRPVYVSVDVDVLDPSAAPGVSTPELLGWTFHMLDEALGSLAGLKNIVGADVVEICPPCDPSGVTSLIGASIVRKLIYLMDAK